MQLMEIRGCMSLESKKIEVKVKHIKERHLNNLVEYSKKHLFLNILHKLQVYMQQTYSAGLQICIFARIQ